MLINCLLIVIALISFVTAVVLLQQRLPSHVLRDLRQDPQQSQPEIKYKLSKFSFIADSAKDLSHLRILSEKEKTEQENIIKLLIIFSALVGLSFVLVLGKANILSVLLLLTAGACCGYILSQHRLRSREELFKQQIVFYLPVVMERIVMAIQSGLDIVPALKTIDQIEMQVNPLKPDSKLDPVTLLLRKVVNLTEAGLSFEAAVHDVTSLVDSHAFKHALIHLAVAQKEGGELFYPLRELSDATQLYFQESVEEEIARMPIKATLPLLMTFAGLLITFMTGPIIQIMNVSANPSFIAGSQHDSAQR